MDTNGNGLNIWKYKQYVYIYIYIYIYKIYKEDDYICLMQVKQELMNITECQLVDKAF